MTELIAYLDESRKPVRDRATRQVLAERTHYVVAAAVVIDGDAETREAIADIETRLGYRLHYADLRSRQRRVETVRELHEVQGWEARVYETARPLETRHHSEHHVRAQTLRSALGDLANQAEVARVVLETRSAPHLGFRQLDEKDHQVLRKLQSDREVPDGFRITHADKSELLLALPDIIAGARSDWLCGVDTEPYSLISHRVRSVTKVFDKTP